MPLLALTRKRWGHAVTPRGFNSVSLNAALVLNYLLEECDDNRWHSLSYRRMGAAIGISNISVYKVLVRLDEWGLIGRKPGNTAHPARFACTPARYASNSSVAASTPTTACRGCTDLYPASADAEVDRQYLEAGKLRKQKTANNRDITKI